MPIFSMACINVLARLVPIALVSSKVDVRTKIAFSVLSNTWQNSLKSFSENADGCTRGISTIRLFPKKEIVPAASTISSTEGAGPANTVGGSLSSSERAVNNIFAALLTK